MRSVNIPKLTIDSGVKLTYESHNQIIKSAAIALEQSSSHLTWSLHLSRRVDDAADEIC